MYDRYEELKKQKALIQEYQTRLDDFITYMDAKILSHKLSYHETMDEFTKDLTESMTKEFQSGECSKLMKKANCKLKEESSEGRNVLYYVIPEDHTIEDVKSVGYFDEAAPVSKWALDFIYAWYEKKDGEDKTFVWYLSVFYGNPGQYGGDAQSRPLRVRSAFEDFDPNDRLEEIWKTHLKWDEKYIESKMALRKLKNVPK